MSTLSVFGAYRVWSVHNISRNMMSVEMMYWKNRLVPNG